MSYLPVTLAGGGLQAQGTSYRVLDVTDPVSSPTSVLVVLASLVASSGEAVALPLGVSELGATYLDVLLPGDGLYSLAALRVEQALFLPLTSSVGEVVYYPFAQSLYQVAEVDSLGNPTWKPLSDSSYLLPSLGVGIYWLHLTSLTQVYNKLLLRVLQAEMGPPVAYNEPEVELLLKYLGQVERGLEGSKYLFQDGNYPEAARTVELLSQGRYL